MARHAKGQFVSRAGEKLDHALREFAVCARGLTCADFGCNVGGFTDCLLRHGAARVYALDSGYGTLAHRLRVDPRVVVMERTNALHAPPPEPPVDLLVIDMAWTRQRHALPAARRWIETSGRIITLVKPHYEIAGAARRRTLRGGRLEPEAAAAVLREVLADFPALGFTPRRHTRSPLTGAKSSRGQATGNVEYLVLAEPTVT